MAANVRCAGGGRGLATIRVCTTAQMVPTDRADNPPCGWTGERYEAGKLSFEAGRRLVPFTAEWTNALRRADAKARTAKSCPRCGGAVELIPAGDAA